MKIRLTFGLVVFGLLASSQLFGGDVATFVNLGFSPKSEYFMFGFHGWDSNRERFFAEIYVVDVAKNQFARGGVLRRTYPGRLSPGQGTAGALYTLLEESSSFSRKFRIQHLAQGRLIYILANGEPPKEELEFRDFVSSNTYTVKMHKEILGSGESVRSAFYLELSVASVKGRTFQYTIGLKNHFRPGIQDYRIRQILLSPDERHIVFVIETLHFGKLGPSIRYMVETARLF